MKNNTNLLAGLAALSIGLLAGTGLAAAASSTTSAPAVSDSDPMMAVDKASFIKAVSSANQFEIETSRLALERSKSPDVKAAAGMIIKDHEMAGKEFASILKKEGEMAKPKLSPKHAAILKELKATKKASFDRKFIEVQTMAHREAIALFKTYSAKPDDRALGDFAMKTLPTLEKHLDHVKMLDAAK